MKSRFMLCLFGITLSQTSIAAEPIALNDIVVTASRVEQPRSKVIGDITVIERPAIERMGAGSFTDLLRLQPGVQISSNGGAGTSSNIFLRGTNDQHVVVLVDGLRINSATLGTTSYENLPLSQIDRVEILRGPASSLYGADAIGGVIQIFTRKNSSDSPNFNAAAGVGSYNTKTAEAGLNAGYENLRYGINVSSMESDSFSAKRIRNNAFDKDDDGYRNLSVSAYTDLTIKDGHTLGLQFFESKATSHFDSGFDNTINQTLQSYAITSKNQLSDVWHSTLKYGMGKDDSDSSARPNNNASSSSFNPSGISTFTTEQKQIFWLNQIKLPLGSLTLAYDRLEQDVVSISNVKTRYNRQRDNNSFLVSYLLDHNNHALQLSLREDHNTQFGNFVTGGAGYGYRFSPAWRVSTSYGNAFKAPTFNQLFFPNFGNENLNPEKSDNVEAGLHYETAKLRAGVTVFKNNIRDLIEFSGPPSGTNPVNVAKAEITGATLVGDWNLNDNLTLMANVTVQSPKNEKTDQLLIRRGNRYGTVSLQHRMGDFQWGAEVTASSVRYNNATNTKVMQGYALLNLSASYQLNSEWKLEARANNLLDKDYVLAFTGNNADSVPYNTAGSNVFVGLRYQMKP